MTRRSALWIPTVLLLLAILPTAVRARAEGGLEILSPQEGQLVPRTFAVEGRIGDAPGVVVAVNGRDVAIQEGRFATLLTASRDGAFRFRIAFGSEGRPATIVERSVRVDGTPPLVTIVEPKGGIGESASSEGVVRGFVEEANLELLTINGVVTPVEDGGFETTFMLPKVGELSVEVVARDRVGNVAREVRTLRRAVRAGTAPAAPGRPPSAPQGVPSTSSIDLCFVLDRAQAAGADDAWAGAIAALKEVTVPSGAGDRVGVYSYDAAVRVEVPMGPSTGLGGWKPERAQRGASRSGLRDALQSAGVDLEKGTASVRHVVLFLGGAPASATEVVAAVSSLAEHGVSVTLISTGGPVKIAGLDESVRSSGGRLFSPKGAAELLRTLRGEMAILVGSRRRNGLGVDTGPAAGRPPPPEARDLAPAVRAALDWLRLHQAPNGSWEAEGFSRYCEGKVVEGEGPDGRGKAMYDVGVTGLALLALLSSGAGSRSGGDSAEAILLGLRYLRSVQDPEGCFGSRSTGHFVYNHAIATLAMIEAFRASGSEVERASAQRGLDFIAIARNPYFAWRYGVKPGDNDTSVAGWMMLAIQGAKLVNSADVRGGKPPTLSVDDEAFDGLKVWIDKMTDPDTGRVGYQARGSGPARPTELVDKFPADKSEAMTAVGMLARIFLGESPRTSDAIQKGVQLCLKLPPKWDGSDGSIDLYYWHHASRAFAAIGGPEAVAWRKAVEEALEGSQRTSGSACDTKGSWDPVDPWGPDGGRVYMTAMAVLCLRAPYAPR